MTLWARLRAWLEARWETPPAPPAPPPSPAPARSGLMDLGKLSPAERRAWLLRHAVDPALAELAALGVKSDRRARVMLLAITGQEADARHRKQIPVAYAMGLLQFEKGGGVWGVLTHKATATHAAALLKARGIKAEASAAWEALARDDVLAFAFGRLLLFSDPKPLPTGADDGWYYYLRNWRPGKPHPDRWPENWRLAEKAVPT